MLPAALLACAMATLFHHIHNAEFLGAYPALPVWITPAGVYAAWLGAAAVGLAGYILLRRGWRFLGAGLLALYGCYGLDGLVHYLLAPASAHTLAMNTSIWLEAAAGTALLLVLAKTFSSSRPGP